MNYRFSPDKGFRRQGEPYHMFESDIAELDSENFDSHEEFLLACFANSSEAIAVDNEEFEDDTN